MPESGREVALMVYCEGAVGIVRILEADIVDLLFVPQEEEQELVVVVVVVEERELDRLK